MSKELNISLVSQSSAVLNSLEKMVENDQSFSIRRVLLSEDELVPQKAEVLKSDVMVIALPESWERMLNALAKQISESNASVVVLGPENEAGIIKQAFKSGAVDYLELNCEAKALTQAIERASKIQKPIAGSSNADLTVLVTPKGGAGSTTLVVNLSHIMASIEDKRVMALDLDFQYGNLPIFYDEKPSTRLANALIQGEQIDTTILDACISRRGSNPTVLATYADQVVSPWDIDMQQISDLFSHINSEYSHVIVDLPRAIDPVTFFALERAHKICVIVQQTISDMRIAHQYIRLLLDQGISSDSIYIVINRYERRNAIRAQDFSAAFQGYRIFQIPNDYKRVKSASENAIAFTDRWKSAPVTKALVDLSQEIWPNSIDANSKRSLFSIDRGTGNKAA